MSVPQDQFAPTTHIRFPLWGLASAVPMPSTVLNHVFAPLGSFNSGTSSLPLFCRVCYATKLANNRKKLHIRNPQKTSLKIVSLIDISRSREQNCCVLLGSQTLGAEFYSALSLSSHPTI